MSTHTATPKSEMDAFEEAAFGQYFLSTIMRNPNPPHPRISGCMDFIATADKTKGEFCAKNPDGNYATESLNSAWWAWQKRAAAACNAHDDLVAALRFILAFYEPGQTCLDTNAWKQAEASGRAALAKAEAA